MDRLKKLNDELQEFKDRALEENQAVEEKKREDACKDQVKMTGVKAGGIPTEEKER